MIPYSANRVSKLIGATFIKARCPSIITKSSDMQTQTLLHIYIMHVWPDVTMFLFANHFPITNCA